METETLKRDYGKTEGTKSKLICLCCYTQGTRDVYEVVLAWSTFQQLDGSNAP